MKFDKRLLLVAALATGISFAAVACDDDDNNTNSSNEGAATCEKTCGENETLNKEKCECEAANAGATEECTKTCEDGEKLDEKKCECVADKKECTKTEKDCAENETFNAEKCKCESTTCGNGKLDEGEACDIVGGVESYAEGKDTCQAWADENKDHNVTLADVEQGKPGCSSDCKALSKKPKGEANGCVTTDDLTCGNGKIDDGELCDVNPDTKEVIFADPSKATCEEAKFGKFGTPGCSKDCKHYAKGSCSEEEINVNGIVSCKAELTVDGAKVSANAEVTTLEADKAVKGKILCGLADDHIKKSINLAKDTFDASEGKIAAERTLTDDELSAENTCVMYVEIESGKGAICSKDGAPIAVAEQKMGELDGIKVTK